jgi:hypothetical protein
MQNQDRENIGEEKNPEDAQGMDGELDSMEANETAEVMGVDPPIIVDGGGQPQR